MTPTLITPPALTLVTLAEANAYLRVTSADEDALIEGFIGAAMQYLDGWGGILGRCIMAQTWKVTLAGFTDQQLPFPDVRAVAVKYLDAALATQTVSPTAYRFGTDSGGGYLIFDSAAALPVTATREDAIWAEVEFGFAPGGNVDGLRVAALMLIAHWYEGREGAQGCPPAVTWLLAPFRWVTL